VVGAALSATFASRFGPLIDGEVVDGGGNSGKTRVAVIPSDCVELSLPARADMLYLVRLHVAASAARLKLGLDVIDELRLAVDELCLMLLTQPVHDDSRLDVVLLWDDDSVEVVCGVRMPSPASARETAGPSLPEQPSALSIALSSHVLDALVDEHGDFSADGQAVSWLRKRLTAPRPMTDHPVL
jgi:hypothetical protein